MNYYLVENSSLGLIRKTLRQFNRRKLDNFKYSSLYILNDFYYLVIKSAVRLDLNSVLPTKLAKTPLEYLTNWGISEISQNVAFISFEDRAKILSNKMEFKFGQELVSRSFNNLSEIMLIINQTPNSFSETKHDFILLDKTLARIVQALEDGVKIIDIGAESTAPNAKTLNPKEEVNRLAPIIKEVFKLKNHYTFKLSLDSYHSTTIIKFLANIDIINDVSGRLDNKSLKLVKESQKTYLFMHSLSVPANPEINIDSTKNPLDVVINFANTRLEQLQKLGFGYNNLIFDPGIGFNKTLNQNWVLLNNVNQLLELPCEVLIGHSRKRFLNKLTAYDYSGRDLETAALSQYLTSQGIDYLRMHNYAEYLCINKVFNQVKS